MILIVDMNENALGYFEFVKPIERIIKDNYETKHYSKITSTKKYEKIILSGCPLQDNEFINHDFGWIKDATIPILGICAGMQIIAKTYGVKLIKKAEIGMTEIKTTLKNNLFEGKFQAYTLHNQAIETNNIFQSLAESKDCIQAIKINNTYGVLFHPEIRNTKIIEKFLLLNPTST